MSLTALSQSLMLWRSLLLSLLLVWLLLGEVALAAELPLEVNSATRTEQIVPSRSSFTSSDISPEKVNQFVQAYLQIMSLIEQREGEMQSAETASESLQVAQEIEAAAMSCIEAVGLKWHEYVQLLTLANLDPDFGERIVAQLQETSLLAE
jgi:hypothetical protein